MHDKRQKSGKMSDSEKDDMSISSEDDPVDDFYGSDQSEFDKGDDISEAENPDEILEKLASEYDQGDSTGEKLASASLAKLVDKIMYTPLHDKKVKEKMERHSHPSNCANMKATKVNQGAYRKLKEYTRKRDMHFYKLQQSLLSGITVITRIADMTKKSKTPDKSQTEQTRQLALDALSLCAHTNFNLNVQRKFLMKPDIGKDYAALCTSDQPQTEWLFGDDLSKSLKEIGDVNRIGKTLVPKHTGNYTAYRGRSSYGRANHYSYGRGNFHKARGYYNKSKNYRQKRGYDRNKNVTAPRIKPCTCV